MLRVGVIGCGKISDGHVEQIRATGLAMPVAVCDREPLMAQQLSLRLQVPGVYSDVTQMLAQERLDVVHVATPPDSHRLLAQQCFDAGVHVFMEKPFALSATETTAILAAASAAGRQISVNYLYNFETPYLELTRLVAAGALGRVLHLDTAYGYNLAGDYGLALMSDPGHWVHRLPGGLFQNLLDHVIAKVAPFLTTMPSVRVDSYRLRASTGIETLDQLPDELRFYLRAGDVSVTGQISAHIRPVMHTLQVQGTKRSVALDIGARTLVGAPSQGVPSAFGRLLPAWSQARAFRGNAWANARRFWHHEFHFFQGMRVLLKQFYQSLADQGPAPLTHDMIQRTADVIDLIVAQTAAPTGASK